MGPKNRWPPRGGPVRWRIGLRIRVFYFEGCPNTVETFELVRRVAREQGVETAIEAVEVRSSAEATRFRFLGSPTVQIDDVDVDPTARHRTEFAMVCRLYGTSGVPAPEMIAEAIREASA
jgi:hypothetical protein